jgi:hypothetical protein
MTQISIIIGLVADATVSVPGKLSFLTLPAPLPDSEKETVVDVELYISTVILATFSPSCGKFKKSNVNEPECKM